MNAADLLIWLYAAIGALFVITVIVVRKWNSYNLPIRLLPLDVLTIVLLIDLNVKSLSNITVDDIVMKMEAIGFTVLLVFVLFAPVLWRVSQGGRKSKTLWKTSGEQNLFFQTVLVSTQKRGSRTEAERRFSQRYAKTEITFTVILP